MWDLPDWNPDSNLASPKKRPNLTIKVRLGPPSLRGILLCSQLLAYLGQRNRQIFENPHRNGFLKRINRGSGKSPCLLHLINHDYLIYRMNDPVFPEVVFFVEIELFLVTYDGYIRLHHIRYGIGFGLSIGQSYIKGGYIDLAGLIQEIISNLPRTSPTTS